MNRLWLSAVVVISCMAVAEETGTIAGTVTWDGKPWTGKVMVYQVDLLDQGFLDTQLVETDSSGTGWFRATGLVPGAYRISPLVEWIERRGRATSSTGTDSHHLNVWLEPGETKEVTLGGGGVTVTGRLELPEDAARAIALEQCCIQRLSRKRDFPTPPENLAEADEVTWLKESGYLNAWCKHTHMLVWMDGEGGFRIPDVPPGEYNLYLEFRDAKDWREEAGYVHQDVTVPELPAGETFDLGALEVQIKPMEGEGAQASDEGAD